MSNPSNTVINDDVKIAYQVLGEQSDQIPLVMVIGLSGVKEDWRHLSANLSKNRQVIVIDNRGLGESDIPDGPYSVELMAGDVINVIDHLGLRKVDCLGHSMGGMISQQIAIASPERVGKLILIGTSHGGPNQAPMKAENAQAFQVDPQASKFEKASKVLTANFTAEWINANPEDYKNIVNASLAQRRSGRGIFHQMSAVMAVNHEEKLPQLSIPTLVIHGTEDQLLDYKNGQMLAEKIPNAELVTLENIGHLTWSMDEGATEKAVERFLMG
ncbi:MAG: alpha/beta hydrolase [Gammaproteobacteria bacterium]|nr:alpha/beta hydrolase [Gammaproteobacteria bacterium]